MDSRAEIKIEMQIYGIKRKIEMSINYYPEDCCGMDRRVIDFFNKTYEEGNEKYRKEIQKIQNKELENEVEISERKELARLLKKFGAS